MAFSINKVYLVGNATNDPELRYTPGGQPVASFTLATNRSIKDKNTGGYRDMATFHKIIVWGKIAEWISKNMPKGSKVVVEGRIDNRTYEKDGTKRYITEIIAENVIPMAAGRRGTATQAPAPTASKPTEPAVATADNPAAGDNPTEPANPETEVAPEDIPF